MAPRAPFGLDTDVMAPPPPVVRTQMSFALDDGYRTGYNTANNSRAQSRADHEVMYTPRGNAVRLPNPIADRNYPIPAQVECPVPSQPFKRDNLWNIQTDNKERDFLKKGVNRMDVSDISCPRSVHHGRRAQRDPLMVNDIAGAQTKAKRIEMLDQNSPDRSKLIIYKRNTNPLNPTYGGNIDVEDQYFKSSVSYANPRFKKDLSQSLHCDDIEKSYSGSLHAHRNSLEIQRKSLYNNDISDARPNASPNKRVPQLNRNTNYIEDIDGTRSKSQVREYKLTSQTLPPVRSPRSSPDGSDFSGNTSLSSASTLSTGRVTQHLVAGPRDIHPTRPAYETPKPPRAGRTNGSKTDRTHNRRRGVEAA